MNSLTLFNKLQESYQISNFSKANFFHPLVPKNSPPQNKKYGGIILDDNLYGKCVLPHSKVKINKVELTILNFFNLIVSPELPNLNINEGKWYVLNSSNSFKINSYDSYTRQFTPQKIISIYCQKIEEKIKKITLTNKMEILCTQKHRFLQSTHPIHNISTWQNLLEVGDKIGTYQNGILKYEEITEISTMKYKGFVFDFQIENTKNFVANEIVCHNTSQPIIEIPNSKNYFKFSKSKKPKKINLIVCPNCRINYWKAQYQQDKIIILTQKNHQSKLQNLTSGTWYVICNYTYWENNFANDKLVFYFSQIDIFEDEIGNPKKTVIWDKISNLKTQIIWFIYNYSSHLLHRLKLDNTTPDLNNLSVTRTNTILLDRMLQVLNPEKGKNDMIYYNNTQNNPKQKTKNYSLQFSDTEREKYTDYLDKFQEIYETSNLKFQDDIYLQKFCSFPQSNLTINYFTLDLESDTPTFENSHHIMNKLGNYGDVLLDTLMSNENLMLECNICLQNIHPHNIGITECGHIFCYSCLLKNSRFHKKCPRCRSPITDNNFYLFIQNWKLSQNTQKHILNKCQEEFKLGTKISSLIKLVINLKKSKIIISNFDDNLNYIAQILEQFKIRCLIINNKNYQKIDQLGTEKIIFLVNYNFKLYKLPSQNQIKYIILNEPYYQNYQLDISMTLSNSWKTKLSTLQSLYSKAVFYRLYVKDSIEETQIQNLDTKVY